MQISQMFEVLPPGSPDTEAIRATFRSRMEKLYAGWDDDFDRCFDNHSFLFSLRDCDNSFLATCRLVFKQDSENMYPTPMEMGDTSRFSIPSKFQTACEGGMVSFMSKEHALALMYGVCNWMMENQIDYCYTTYDVRNILIKRLYTQVLGFSLVDSKIVEFSGFKSKKTGLPVQWQVLENSCENNLKILEDLRAKGAGFQYELGKYPRLIDWMKRGQKTIRERERAISFVS